ncbi:hypothetical protein GGG16DRAFT_120458 [Schizophyllum commune]
MVGLQHEVRVFEHQLCRHCNYTFHAPVCAPPAGADSSALRFGHDLEAEDVDLIAKSAASTQGYLADIDLEIETLQSTLRWAQKVRAELKQLHDIQQAYLAPVRKLPADVLSIIFELCCGDEIDLTDWTCAPIDLSAVCKLWRETMLSMPMIWARLSLDKVDRTGFLPSPGKLAARVQAFLKHSGVLPLKHRVYYEARLMDDTQDPNEKVIAPLDLLLEHTHRWTALRVRCDSRCPPHLLSRALHGRPFPQLTSLEGRADDLQKIDDIFMIPTLRCLKLTQDSSSPIIPTKLPFSQLTELHTYSRAGYALSVLQLCPNIEVFDHAPKYYFWGVDEGPEWSTVVVLPHLRRLVTTIQDERDLVLLDGLCAPALQTLSLDWSTPLAPDQRAYVAAFVTRSSCRLRELCLTSAPLVEQECISSLNDLTTLVLSAGVSCSPIRPSLLEELGSRDGTGAPRMLPHLQNLRLGPVLTFTTTEMVEVVQARRLMGCPLRVVVFLFGVHGEIDFVCFE